MSASALKCSQNDFSNYAFYIPPGVEFLEVVGQKFICPSQDEEQMQETTST